MKTAVAIHEDDLTELQAAGLLSPARIIAGDVTAPKEHERVDGETVQRPIAVTDNEIEPVRAFFLQ